MDGLRLRIRDGSLLFLLLPLIYFLLFGFDGFADTDQGFVPGLAWRVKLGQWPYRDFVYVRPPLTPVLHALEIWLWPLRFQVLGMRLDYYLMMFGSVAFGILALRRVVDFERLGIQPWVLGTLAFIFSVHNFPAMPWHTVDGVFFGSLGLWWLSHPHSRLQATLGLLTLAVAGLAKQPFAILFPMGIALLFTLQPRRFALQVTSTSLVIVAAGVLSGMVLLPEDVFPKMLEQVLGAGNLPDLLKAGGKSYVLPALLFVLPLLLLSRWAHRRGGALASRLGMSVLLAIALFPLAHAGLAFWKMTFMPPRLGVYHALLLVGVAGAVSEYKAGRQRAAALLFGMASIAWASGISWGYASPAMFALPGLAGTLLFVKGQLGFEWKPRHFAWIGGLAFVGFSLLQLFPYRDAPRWELQAGAGEVFPVLSHIRSSPENVARLQELQDLSDSLDGRCVVLPAHPGADYLLQREPMLGIDWEHDAEIGAKQLPAMIRSLDELGIPVLVERARIPEASSQDLHYRSSLLAHVLDHYSRVGSNRFFDVYLLQETNTNAQ